MLRSLAISLACCLAACTCGGSDDEDARPPVRDAAVDADAAGGLDASDAQSPPDASDPRDPGWVTMPGLPDGCVVQRAEHPEVLFEPVWIPCREGPPGCEELNSPGGIIGMDFAYHDGERGYLSGLLPDPGSNSFPDPTPGVGHSQIKALLTTDSPAIAAWRYEIGVSGRYCRVTPFNAGEGRGGFGIFTWWEDLPMSQRFYVGAHESLRTITAPLATVGTELIRQSIEDIYVSRDMAAIADMSFMAVLEPSGKVRVLSPLPGLPAMVVQAPVSLIGPDLFWHDSTNYVRVAHATPDRDSETFLEVEGGGDIRSFVTDGHDMAWYAAYYAPNGYDYERMELWTAPHTADPAVLKPRRVADIDPPLYRPGEIGEGYFAFERRLGEGRPVRYEVVVYRLADGKQASVRYPEGIFVHALYVGGDTVVAYSDSPGQARLFRSYLDGALFE